MYQNFLNDCKVVKVQDGAASGTSTLTTSTIAMQGYDSVAFIADLGAVTAGAVMQLVGLDGYQSNGSDAAEMVDPGNNNVATPAYTDVGGASSNGQIVLDVQRPQKPYVTASFSRAGGAAVNSITAILYNAYDRPVAQPASVVASAGFLAAQ